MKKILLINCNFFGDTLLTTPAIQSLRKHYKDAFIVTLVGENAKEILVNNPCIDEIIVRKKGKDTFFSLLKKIKKYKFDLAILFQDTLENALLSFLACIPQRIGYKKEKAEIFLTNVIKKTTQHIIYSHLELLQFLKIEKNSYLMEVFLTKEEEENAEILLKKENIKNNDLLIALHPGTTRRTKQWPLNRFAQVGDFISQKDDIRVIITGDKNDHLIAKEILSLMKKPAVNLVGKTTIKELAYIFKKCKIVISPDTGPMHLAVAMKNPIVLALFGSTNPVIFGPLGEKHIIFYKNIRCNPCHRDKCRYNSLKCMKLITEKEVISAIGKLVL